MERDCKCSKNIRRARRALKSLRDGDIPTLFSLLANNVVWTEHATVEAIPFAGIWIGLDPSNPRSVPALAQIISRVEVPVIPIQIVKDYQVNCSCTVVTQSFINTHRYRCLNNPEIVSDVLVSECIFRVTFNKCHLIEKVDIFFGADEAAIFFTQNCA